MKIKYYIVFIFLIYKSSISFGQEKWGKGVDSIPKKDSIPTLVDTISSEESIKPWHKSYTSFTSADTLKKVDSTTISVKISKDGIEEEVKYSAVDSSWTDLINDKIHLYGNATVDYQTMKLTAEYMVIDFSSSIIEGFTIKDAKGKTKQKPTFTDGSNTFTYDEIKYNFKSKKGIVKHAITQEGEFNIVGTTTKFISGQTDSLGVKSDDVGYQKDAIITTCTHDPPHYGIRANKLKFVPNKLAVLSFAQIELASVPTPLFLPFGFFPLIKGKSSGLIFPASYEFNDQLGLGFREIGYYFPINEYLDMRVTGDIYTRGTHGLRVSGNYKKRYGYTGSVLLGYSNNKIDNDTDGGKLSQKSFSISVRHNQDAKAHPYRKLGGAINIQTNRYEQRTYENVQAALQNTYSSNFSFSHSMPGTPFQFNAEFRHSQNTQTRVMDITLPNMTLRMNTINPFKRKNNTTERWTDNISLSYNSEFRNFVKTTDTTLFTSQTLKDLQTGIAHKASLSTNFKVLKYLNVSPNASYDEYWFLRKYQQTFYPDSVRLDTITGDTLGFKAPISSFENGFTTYRNVNTGVAINTQIFGTRSFSKGFIRGFRHIMKPNISFNYKPGNLDRYQEVVDTDTRADYNDPLTYSIFTNGPFGTLNGSEKQMAISYGITNVLEAKYWSRKDTTEKIMRIFDNINILGNYNFALDSFRWSNISINGNTRILKGLTNFNFSTVFSPYAYTNDDVKTKETVWSRGKVLPEFRTFAGQFSTGISFSRIREIFGGKAENKTSPNRSSNNLPPNIDTASKLRGQAFNETPPDDQQGQENPDEEGSDKETTSLADWFGNFNISHAYNFNIRKVEGRDTFVVNSHSINISGSIPLTKNWNMNIGNIAYDFKNKSFVYPYFSFARDLHCWQMNFTWAPSNGVYSFYVGVKSSALSFLKYDYGQRNANTLFTGNR